MNDLMKIVAIKDDVQSARDKEIKAMKDKLLSAHADIYGKCHGQDKTGSRQFKKVCCTGLCCYQFVFMLLNICNMNFLQK